MAHAGGAGARPELVGRVGHPVVQILESELVFEKGKPPIGTGGFGKVVRARFIPSGSPAGSPGRLVAVKSMLVEFERGKAVVSDADRKSFLCVRLHPALPLPPGPPVLDHPPHSCTPAGRR